jgi:hypothetical protein
MTFDVRDQAAYDALQTKLVPLWKSIERLNTDEQTIVVLPSIDVDLELTPGQMQAYEERYLFLLLLLRQPRARMIYLTSHEIDRGIVDYYLELLPGVEPGHARERLFLLSPEDPEVRPLSRKIIDRPAFLERIRSLIIDTDRAHLVPFMATWDDREVAMRLGIPMYGADPKYSALGNKTEGRRLFAEAGISHPVGREDLGSRAEVVDAIASMRTENPGIRRVVVKHNEGVSGFGNVTVRLDGLPAPGEAGERPAIAARLDRIRVEAPGSTPDAYFETLARKRGIVEEMIEAGEIRSPSVQLRITPLGAVELLSTHDQVLGGASGQVFMGSRFPADPGYASTISADARKLGERLAGLGIIGRFAIDFVVARDGDGPWSSHAIELNLRKGGTTHPFLTLQFLTDGAYDDRTGLFVSPGGDHKFYVGTDHLAAPGLERLTPRALLDLAAANGWLFDQGHQAGTVFHMLSALPDGQVGVTCVGDSPADAQRRYDEVVATLTG